MKIRSAKVKDAIIIRQISLALSISRDSKRPVGFVDYVAPNATELKRRIRGNKLFFVAEESSIIGFISAYTDSLLKELDFSEDQITQYLIKTKEPPFIYWDLLAIVDDYQKKGYGLKLADHFLKEAVRVGYRVIYAAIAHKPHKNNISIKLLKRLSFKFLEEVEVYNGLIFGIYRKSF